MLVPPRDGRAIMLFLRQRNWRLKPCGTLQWHATGTRQEVIGRTRAMEQGTGTAIVLAMLRGGGSVREGQPNARTRARFQQLRCRRVHEPRPPRAPGRQVGPVVALRRSRGRRSGRGRTLARRQHQHHRRVAVRGRRRHLPLLLRPRRPGRPAGAAGPGLQAHEARDNAWSGSIGGGGVRWRWRLLRRQGRRRRGREPAGSVAEGRGEEPARGEDPALAREAAVPVEEVEQHAGRAAATVQRRLLLHYGQAAHRYSPVCQASSASVCLFFPRVRSCHLLTSRLFYRPVLRSGR
jgi:hypothetical protein